MRRINVTFYDETYEKLDVRMKKNSGKSIAHGIRELVDLGLKIEEAAQKNTDNPDENNAAQLMAMLENNLIWSLETRLLTRYLVESLPESNKEKLIEILEKYKESAANYIKGMLGKKIK